MSGRTIKQRFLFVCPYNPSISCDILTPIKTQKQANEIIRKMHEEASSNQIIMDSNPAITEVSQFDFNTFSDSNDFETNIIQTNDQNIGFEIRPDLVIQTDLTNYDEFYQTDNDYGDDYPDYL